MPFGLIPKVLDAIDMTMLVCKDFVVIDAVVLKLRHIQGIVGMIGLPPILWTHSKRFIMSQEVCHGKAKDI